ncbi:MAG: transposase [Aridibacter famidurans]|nr:transposase [Aridibacter famidurans]
MTDEPILLDKDARSIVDQTIREVCTYRNYILQAINVRTNHVHVVVTADTHPRFVVNAFKSYATRKLREKEHYGTERRIWARGSSNKYLWDGKSVGNAIDYVLYCQGDEFAGAEQWMDEFPDFEETQRSDGQK